MVKMCGSALLLLFTLAVPAQAETWVLGELFGTREDSMSAVLIAETAGIDSANVYRALERSEKGVYLQAFWGARNTLFGRLYYGYHLGYRYLTVSDAFF